MPGGTLDTADSSSPSPTGFSPSMMCLPMHFGWIPGSRMLSTTPKVFLPPVWPIPRSLAATSGISFDVSSSPYLDVSVQAVPLLYLWIQYRIPEYELW